MIWQLAALQICFFAILVFVLQKFFHGNLIRAINRFEVLRKKNILKEEELEEAYRELARKHDQEVKTIEMEVAQIRRNAEQEVNHLKQVALEKLDQRIQSQQQAFIEKEKGLEVRIAEEAKQKAGELACELIKNCFTLKMREGLHEDLCHELIACLPEILPEKIDPLEYVRVRSAFPLSESDKKNLVAQVSRILSVSGDVSRELSIKEEIDPNLALV